MNAKPRAFARSAALVLAAATVGAGGVFFVAAPAYAAVPTITSVVVAGTTNKVVTAGNSVLITGTGFLGMTDNFDAVTPNCPDTPVATTACSEVRFVGVGTGTNYTRAARFTVVSDTQIYAVVPSITASDGTTNGAPTAGTGSVKVQVVNTMPGGNSSLGSVITGTTSEVFYRHPLTAAITGTVSANPLGGGTVNVTVTGVAPLTDGATGTFIKEKITAQLYNNWDQDAAGTAFVPGQGMVRVTAATVAWVDATTVKVTIPQGSPSNQFYGVMLLHDGVVGTADTDAVKYPAVITKIETCPTFSAAPSTPPASYPTCTGPASASASATTVDFKVTGKGFTGATAWTLTGPAASTYTIATGDCDDVSDFVAYCRVSVASPAADVATLSFTADDADDATAAGAAAVSAGAIFVFTDLI